MDSAAHPQANTQAYPVTKPVLSLVIPCKGRLAQLQQSLPRLLKQSAGTTAPGTLLQSIVVDYNCPEHCGDWVRQNHPAALVAHVPQVADFNTACARNTGARHATAPWIGFVDADVLLAPGFLAAVLPKLIDNTVLLAPAGTYDLGGFVICPTAMFHTLGGYDETYEGWGCEDRDFQLRLTAFGGLPEVLPAHLMSGISHPDADRTRFHEVQDRFLSLRINALYSQAKTDLARQRGILQLADQERAHLYARVKAAVMANPEAPAMLDIALPPSDDVVTPPGWQLTRQWVYRFSPNPLL